MLTAQALVRPASVFHPPLPRCPAGVGGGRGRADASSGAHLLLGRHSGPVPPAGTFCAHDGHVAGGECLPRELSSLGTL